jgi:hypothetical protein
MPDPTERHGKSDDWSAQPSRSQLRRMAVTDEAKRSPARKDRDLCKAAHWKGPHEPAIVFAGHVFHKGPCRWSPMWDGEAGGYRAGWMCLHEERCGNCGKVLRMSLARTECPDFEAAKGLLPAAEAEAEAATKRHYAWREKHSSRKPAITGPQGYRKRRAS